MRESPAKKRESFVLACCWPGIENYLLSSDTCWTNLAMQLCIAQSWFLFSEKVCCSSRAR